MITILCTVAGVIGLGVFNQIVNLYAEQWKKRHELTAGKHMDWVAEKALGWRWHFRWIAIFMGSSAASLPAEITSPENPPVSLPSAAGFSDHFIKTTAATMLIADVPHVSR